MSNKRSFEEVKSKFDDRGFELLSKVYFNAHRKLRYKCPKGHINSMNWNKFSMGRGCPDCKIEKMFGTKYGFKHGKSHTSEYRREMEHKRRSEMPWETTFYKIKERCNNPKHKSFKYYGAKGIKCLITKKELKYLWFRDKAYLMERPSIDRKNSDKNYTLKNCRYLELRKNVQNMQKEYITIKIKKRLLNGKS